MRVARCAPGQAMASKVMCKLWVRRAFNVLRARPPHFLPLPPTPSHFLPVLAGSVPRGFEPLLLWVLTAFLCAKCALAFF